MKKSYVMALITFILLGLSFSLFFEINEVDKSNYVLDYENMNLLIEYCKVKDIKIFNGSRYQIINKNPLKVYDKRKKEYLYINC